MALLLFDIDGTILKSGGAGMRAMLDVARELFGEHWTWDGIETAGNLDTLIFAEAAALNRLDHDPQHHDRFRRLYLEYLALELERSKAAVELMPGIAELLAQLHTRMRTQADMTLAILTGNYHEAVPLKLRAVGIDPDWFAMLICAEHGPTRPDLVGAAMQRHAERQGRPVDPREVIVIGDTPRDVQCAHAHRCRAVAVATGRYTVAELEAAQADLVLADLSDPAPLLAMVEQAIAVPGPGGVGTSAPLAP